MYISQPSTTKLPHNTMQHHNNSAEGDSNLNVNNNSNSVASVPLMTATHPVTKTKKPPRFTRVDGDTMGSIEKVLQDLSANDYRLRWSGLDLLSEMILQKNKVAAVSVHINKVGGRGAFVG